MNISLEKNFEYFLNHDFPEYGEGEWIAIYNNGVISHGNDLKRVIKKAEETAPISKVLLTKVKRTARYL